MKIISNETSYDTRAVRRVLQAVYRAVQRRDGSARNVWPSMRVKLLERRLRRVQQIKIDAWPDLLKIYLPKLQGAEFIGLARQQHGGSLDHDHGGVYTIGLALQVQAALYAVLGRRYSRRGRRYVELVEALQRELDERRMLRGIPPLIPLRVLTPATLRDKLRDKLARTLELKLNWQRKAKLAGTKLKKLTSLQKRYEKQLARREGT